MGLLISGGIGGKRILRAARDNLGPRGNGRHLGKPSRDGAGPENPKE
jgi:hypothetical protein